MRSDHHENDISMEPVVSTQFTVEIGSLIRREVAACIRSSALLNHVDLNLDEGKGFLSSTFKADLRGRKEDVMRVIRATQSFIDQVNEVDEKRRKWEQR